jgi:hypothetical protein
MDINNLAVSIAIGFVAGISTLLIVSMVLIPVSYVMNRFIYHHSIMRIALGFVAFVLFPFFFVGMIIMYFTGLRPAHYFGLIPVYLQMTESVEPTGTFAFLFKILSVIPHPFLGSVDTADGVAAYQASMNPLLAAEGIPRLDEGLERRWTAAGDIPDDARWNETMRELKEPCENMFFPKNLSTASAVAPPVPVDP